MKDKIKAITKNSIVQNLSILVLGTILAQVIVIGFQLVLRRLYSPSDFGAFAVYMSILGILSSVSSLRYVQTIILPKQKTDGIKLFKISIFLTFIFSAILCLLIIFFLDNIVLWFNFPKNYSQWLFVIPLSVFMFSFSNAGNYFLIREKQFRISASNKIVRRIGEGTTQTFFALASKSAGLFIGDLIGQLFVSLRIVLKYKKIFSYKFSIKEYLEIAKKYKHFPIKNTLPALFNTLSLLLPIVILNKTFTTQQTGYFDLARMLLILPLSLVTESLSQVILQRFSEYKNQQKSIKKEALNIFLSLSIFSIIFTFIIYSFGEFLFVQIFGNQWIISGEYAKILIWAFALKFIVSPFNINFTAFQRIGILSIWQTIYFLLILLLLIMKFDNINHFLYTYLFIELISYTVAGILGFSLIFNYEKSIEKHL